MSEPRDPTSSPPHLNLMLELALIVRFWRVLMDDQLRAFSITHTHGTILWWIAEGQNLLSQTELARKLGIETSTLVRQLDVLETRGLITREMISDRRVRLIKLTPEGVKIAGRNRKIAEELSRELLEGISIEDVTRCADLMNQLRLRLQSDRDEVPEDQHDIQKARPKRQRHIA